MWHYIEMFVLVMFLPLCISLWGLYSAYEKAEKEIAGYKQQIRETNKYLEQFHRDIEQREAELSRREEIVSQREAELNT